MIVAERTVTQPVQVASATLRVNVPSDARVFVNDRATTSTGAERKYVSHGLKASDQYQYRVRVEYDRNGETVTETKVATLTAGASELLDFGAEEQTVVAAKPVETKLSVVVPADAKITLSGAKTVQTGAEREFRTTRLAAGESWRGYVVRVEVGDNVQERTITLTGGESQRLVFTFDESAATLAAL